MTRLPVAVLVLAAIAAPVAAQQPGLRIVGDPTWFWEPNEGNPAVGHLHYAALVENTSPQPLHFGLSFRSSVPDGTRLDACTGMGGDGSGVSDHVRPGERAWLTCSRSIVPRARLDGLRVTAQLWDVTPLATRSLSGLRFTRSGIETGPAPTEFRPFVLVESANPGEVDLRIRVYDAGGVQVGTCESERVTLEPGIAVRAVCWGSGIVVPGPPERRPVRVVAEIAR